MFHSTISDFKDVRKNQRRNQLLVRPRRGLEERHHQQAHPRNEGGDGQRRCGGRCLRGGPHRRRAGEARR